MARPSERPRVDKVAAPEDADRRSADGSREMERSAVVRHDEVCRGEQAGEPEQVEPSREIYRTAAHRADDVRDDFPLLVCPDDRDGRSATDECVADGRERLGRPAPSRVAGGGMDDDQGTTARLDGERLPGRLSVGRAQTAI